MFTPVIQRFAPGVSGTLDVDHTRRYPRFEVDSFVNAGDDEVPFGYGVVRPASVITEQDAVLPTDISQLVLGINVRGDRIDGELGPGGGLKRGSMLSVLVRGRVWIVVEEPVARGERLRIALGGALGSSPDYQIDASGLGMWRTSASAGSRALLSFDAGNKP